MAAPSSVDRSPLSRHVPRNVPPHTPKNILVTGGAGFIGHHMAIRLVTRYPQYRIINYDKLDYCASLANLQSIANMPNYKFVKGNILSADLLTYIFANEQIDTVIHFAAQTHVDNSFGNSFQFTETNVLGTHVLLETAKAAGIKKFIHISTDEVYGEVEAHTDAHESAVLEPTNPYAATKAAAELIAKSYYRSFNLPVVITRANNIYGPGQFPEKIIPKFICLLQRGQPLPIHGSGMNRRKYLFVEDAVEAFDLLIHQGIPGETYNVGTDFECTNLDVAKTLIRLLGMEGRMDELIKHVEDRLFNDRRYSIDSTKIRELGWCPKISWEEGLKRTIDWYRGVSKDQWQSRIEEALVPHPRIGQSTLTSI